MTRIEYVTICDFCKRETRLDSPTSHGWTIRIVGEDYKNAQHFCPKCKRSRLTCRNQVSEQTA